MLSLSCNQNPKPENPMSAENPSPDPSSPSFMESVRALESIGRAWAVHGLEMGRQALSLSANTLETYAKHVARILFDHQNPTGRMFPAVQLGMDLRGQEGMKAVVESATGRGSGVWRGALGKFQQFLTAKAAEGQATGLASWPEPAQAAAPVAAAGCRGWVAGPERGGVQPAPAQPATLSRGGPLTQFLGKTDEPGCPICRRGRGICTRSTPAPTISLFPFFAGTE